MNAKSSKVMQDVSAIMDNSGLDPYEQCSTMVMLVAVHLKALEDLSGVRSSPIEVRVLKREVVTEEMRSAVLKAMRKMDEAREKLGVGRRS